MFWWIVGVFVNGDSNLTVQWLFLFVLSFFFDTFLSAAVAEISSFVAFGYGVLVVVSCFGFCLG